MKKIILFLFAICTFTTLRAQFSRVVSKEEAINAVMSSGISNEANVYFIPDENPSFTHLCIVWKFFVDPSPNKGWEHQAFIYTIPQITGRGETMSIDVTEVKLPPSTTLEPVHIAPTSIAEDNDFPYVELQQTNTISSDISRTKAVIINGGINKNSNYFRYWNDCSFIYQTLSKKYGIDSENIFVLMSDGTNPNVDTKLSTGQYISSPLDLDFDGTADIRYSASRANVYNILDSLSTTMQEDDHLLIYVIDHGGLSYSGHSYIHLWNNETISDTELAELIRPFCQNYVNVNVVLGQCYSGGFIDALNQNGCVVSTACSGNESSYACADIPYDEFVYQWTSAINGANHLGIPVNSDTDGDGIITMLEAFNYAKNNDRDSREHPQYNSYPRSVGEDLAINKIAKSECVYIRDNFEDTGKEPNISTDVFWNSPDIWIRNIDDNVEEHENPILSIDHPGAFVYARVHNRGKKAINNNKWLHLYWGKASTGLSKKTWNGYELYNETIISGEPLRPANIGYLEPGESKIIKVTWNLPYDMLGNLNETEEHHFCLLARITNSRFNDYIDSTEGLEQYNVRIENTSAQKNLTIIPRENLYKSMQLYVRNLSCDTKNYSLEVRPKCTEDYQLFNDADITMKMSTPILNAWNRGGQNGSNIYYAPALDPYTVTFVSPNSKLERVNLNSGEFDVVSMNFDFHTNASPHQPYMIDVIQRDENGEIVGGETFLVEAPEVSNETIDICYNNSGTNNDHYNLWIDTDENNLHTNWYDYNGNLLSNKDSINIEPKKNKNTFFVSNINKNGIISNGSITLPLNYGIESIMPKGQISDNIEIILKKENYSDNSYIQIRSIINGEILINEQIEKNKKSLSINLTGLFPGFYDLMYINKGDIIESHRFKKGF